MNQEETICPPLPVDGEGPPNDKNSWRFPLPRQFAKLRTSLRSLLSGSGGDQSPESLLSEHESIFSDDSCSGHEVPLSPLEAGLEGSSETLPIRRLAKTPVEGN